MNNYTKGPQLTEWETIYNRSMNKTLVNVIGGSLLTAVLAGGLIYNMILGYVPVKIMLEQGKSRKTIEQELDRDVYSRHIMIKFENGEWKPIGEDFFRIITTPGRKIAYYLNDKSKGEGE